MGSRISFSGLGTGIDFQSVVDSIIGFESRRVDLILARQAEETTRLSLVRSFNSLLLSFRNQASLLADPGDFDVRQAVSSNPTAVTADLTGNAALTTQTITVNALAQAAQVASQGIAGVDTVIGTGTVDITLGGTTTTIDVDTTNNTLEGLRDAINESDADVTATIINDGSSTNPYRLLVTGNQTGAVNALSIAVNLIGGAQTPDFTNNVIDSAEADSNNNAAYTGLAQSGGTYTGNENKMFIVEILSGGAVGAATFRFSADGGQTFDDNGGAGYLATTTNTALAEGVEVSFTDSGTLTAGDRFTIDVFTPQVQDATDASITLGASGGAPITIASSSNTVTDLIPGVTLTLNETTSGPVQISVSADDASVMAAINQFVDSFNRVLDFLDDQLGFDPDTENAGLLIGDSLLTTTQNQLRRIMTGTVPGLPSNLNRLSAIGISTNVQSGRLEIDNTILSKAVSDDLDAVAAIFSTTFGSDRAGISIVATTENTADAANGFEVDITQAARQGTFTGTLLGSFPITLTSANNELVLIVDGQESGLITLNPRTYNTANELAAEVEARINADTTLGGRTVTVSVDSGALVITSKNFGSISEVDLGAAPANSAFSVLGLTGGASVDGLDVGGTINGEAATGAGQVLTGNDDNATTAGLVLLVTLSQNQLDENGPEATVRVTEGISRQLEDALTFLTDPVDGRITRREKFINLLIDDLNDTVERQQERLIAHRESLLLEFSRLEAFLSQITAQGELFIQQLANIPRIDTLTRRRSN